VAEPQARFGGNTTTFFAVTTLAAYISAGAHSFGLHSMTFWARLIIYAGTVLLYVGTAAWIVRAWCPSDLYYIAAGIVLVVSAGLGVLVASQIVVVLGYTG